MNDFLLDHYHHHLTEVIAMIKGKIPKLVMESLGVYLVVLLMAVKAAEATIPNVIARSGCKDFCGNVSIPFPFGIGADCFLDSRYEIECRAYKPILSKFDVEVVAMQADSRPKMPIGCYDCGQSITIRLPPLKVCSSGTQGLRKSSIDLIGSPYNFSMDDNQVFLVKGCAGSTTLVGEELKMLAGCSTVCHNDNNTNVFRNHLCYGVECCQAQLPSLRRNYSNPQIYHVDFYGEASGQNCIAATMIGSDYVRDQNYTGNWSASSAMTVPTILYWSWLSRQWPESDPDHSLCLHDEKTNSTKCICKANHFGNPYVAGGCQGDCIWCIKGPCLSMCPNGSDPTIRIRLNSIFIFSIGICIAVGPLLLAFGGIWFYRFIKKRKKTERRVKFFKLKLQEHQSFGEGVAERTKIFTHKQLDRATNHFNEKRVLGKGGQGIVYKGMLYDGRTVAIKQLKTMDESQMEQFINEVVILSQINHRNVVKLLGCCLETEVPLLVYEFISNRTLSELIHAPDEDFSLTWMMRMKIAIATAQAVAYLHSYSSIPIYHRDIKSANILLDEKYIAKVSDFGSSKIITMDQTHLTTLVQGTIGYLDPEYFYSNQYTDKSDVYSFGVVLLELLTGKKPNYITETMEQKNLVAEFSSLTEMNELSYILDLEVVKEAKEEEFMVVIDLARRCLSETGNLRPTMKEVAMTLEMIIKSPNEVPKLDEQAFLHTEFGASMVLCDSKFKSNSLRPGATSSLYVDVQPLLRDTI